MIAFAPSAPLVRRGAAVRLSSRAAARPLRSPQPVRSAPKMLSWDDHQAVAAPADSLVRAGEVDGDGMRVRFEAMIRRVQNSICAEVEALDGGTFHEDAWVRPGGGGGISRVIQGGKVFEKAGVNVSVVYGTMPPEAVAAASARGVTRDAGYAEGEAVPFFAAGVSSVMHPRNPMAPTMHFNYRYFETDRGLWWFGGGTDLTPAFVYEEDVRHFHGSLKTVCDRHDDTYYPRFKKWADEYFVNKHRGETRGVGGIFFDDLNAGNQDDILKFSTDCAENVTKAYLPIVTKRMNETFTEKQLEWQQIRRGRYAEYNLVYDRGTVFGLKTGGRIESILMSLPLTCRYEYDHSPEPGSWEEKSLSFFKTPHEWV